MDNLADDIRMAEIDYLKERGLWEDYKKQKEKTGISLEEYINENSDIL